MPTKRPAWDRTPFTIVIDTREQHRWHMDGMSADAEEPDSGIYAYAVELAAQALSDIGRGVPEVDRVAKIADVYARIREDLKPWHFDGFASNRKIDGQNVPLIVPTEVSTLKSGDYSIRGCEDLIAVERKSIPDLFSTLTHGRDRFVRELERLQEMQFACVIVEGDWDAILRYRETQVNPKTIYHSVLAFQQRFPGVHWWMCPSRNFAERTALRVLERFWKERGHQP